MEELKGRLATVVTVVNPWDDHQFDAEIELANAEDSRAERIARWHRINMGIGSKNEELIRSCEAVVAVLDGVDIDSGTAAEIGFAYALGQRVYGLRTDWRLAGDNDAAGVNLQVRYFIETSGGSYHTSVESLVGALRTEPLAASR
jgi:nucleoside 2-deoxyribosyltransferase